MKGYIKLRKKAIELLESNLSKKLTYHGIHHTMDVLNICNDYIRRLKISKKDAQLLRIAALYHDIGFTETYKNHEQKAVEILSRCMKEFDCDMKYFDVLKKLIMATQIPQNPKSQLENIICDSDLDYLGKDKYYEISNTLFQELKNYKMIDNEDQWNRIQVSFLKSHEYHTEYAKKTLEAGKRKRIKEISKLIN
jgi:putative nucleotidyltransferase with HDIG domain